MGEFYALLSAASFGVAGAAVAKGAPAAKGDNGVFLSVILTLMLSVFLWVFLGLDFDAIDGAQAFLNGLLFFAAAGILATVFGRLTNYRSIALSGAIRSSLFRRLIPIFSTILAFTVLGERYSPLVLTGMILILASVAIVVLARRSSSKGNIELFTPNQVRLGLLFGAVSAFCYALAYIARKLAMVHLPDAALGAFIGALTGVVWYVFASPFSMRYRQSLTNVFADAGKWQWLAATGMSFGQVLLFFALISAPVAVVAIIGSLEMFVGAYLAAFLFKSEPVPGRNIVFATVIAATGTVLVAIG